MIRWMRPGWGWPVVIICSAVAASLVTFVTPATAARPIFVMWFLFVCPGMTLVRFFRIREVVVTWILALALSVSIDAIVASILLYGGRWSPTTTLSILIAYCLTGAVVLLATTALPGLTRQRASEGLHRS
jgi:hypothetical protein